MAPVKRTHKFSALGDVAKIVAASPNISAAAKRLGVDRSTVHRWIKSGRIQPPAAWQEHEAVGAAALTSASPESWEAWVRAQYDLDQTGLTLLELAASTLALARSDKENPATRLQAMGRFQLIVKQMNLTPAAVTPTAKPEQPRAVSSARTLRSAGDPRALLTAV